MAPCLASPALLLSHSTLLASPPLVRRAGKSKAPLVSPFLHVPSFYQYNSSLHRGFRVGHLLVGAHLPYHNNGCSHDHCDEVDHHADEDHTHSHEDHITHQHQKPGRTQGGQAHSHCYAGESDPTHNAVQRNILIVAAALGLTRLADALRDNFRLCCLSMAMLLLAAVCPYVLQPQLGSSVQSGLAFSAFPLVGVPAILDAAVDIAGLKVNIHVLMALAAFASLLMGNALEGGLLLAMFSFSHIGTILHLLLGLFLCFFLYLILFGQTPPRDEDSRVPHDLLFFDVM